MKRNTKIKALIAALILFTLLPMTVAPSHAMTPLPPSLINGSATSGAQLPIESAAIIENQKITYNIDSLPHIHGEASNDGYTASVQTEYTLFNPTDSDLTIRIALPIGKVPSYYYGVDDSYELSKHSIAVNGEKIELELRHAYNDYSHYGEVPDFGAILSDEYYSDEYCSPDMTVTKYTFKQSGVTKEGAFVGFDINDSKMKGSCLYLGEYANAWDQRDGDRRVNVRAGENGCTYELYVFGNDLTHLPEWKVYKDVGVEDGEEIGGKIEYVSKETTSFMEFVSQYYDESLGINELDWFNMAATEIASTIKRNVSYTTLYGLNTSFASNWVGGYIYEITIAPGERVINTINLPIYPDVETGYEPYTYQYNYLLFHANAEMFTGQINVKVNTPYYMLEGKNFVKSENGYSLSFNAKETTGEYSAVIHGSIYFTLCESENPDEVERSNSTGWLIILILFVLLPIGLVIEAVESIVKAVKNGFNSLRSKIIK